MPVVGERVSQVEPLVMPAEQFMVDPGPASLSTWIVSVGPKAKPYVIWNWNPV